MKNLYTLVLTALAGIGTAQAQYCSPTFTFGCTLWRNMTISVGTINWTIGATACTTSDYTSLSTTLTAGVAEPMTVTSGNWTGCAVWIDLNDNDVFEDVENLYYAYVGGDPSYTYSFTITVPPGTPSGPYRMRVLAPWGSDGFTPGSINGFGPCGAYEYGNFDDFTVNVSGSTAIGTNAAADVLVARPNPTTGELMLSTGAGPVERLMITAADGRCVRDVAVPPATAPAPIDLSGLPPGLYTVGAVIEGRLRTARIVKE